MSRYAISSGEGASAGAIAWQLAQTFWVGAVWLLQFVLLPAMLHRTGLAPLLVEDVARELRPLVVGLGLSCSAVQSLVLTRALSVSGLWKDLRGQMLCSVILLGGLHLVLTALSVDAGYWLMFSYLAIACLGLMLVLQPIPQVRPAQSAV